MDEKWKQTLEGIKMQAKKLEFDQISEPI